MGKVMDYLAWRGDLDFIHDPLNDVDALILALLSYLPFNSIVPELGSNEGISLKETASEFLSANQTSDPKPDGVQPKLLASFNSGLLNLLTGSGEVPAF